MWASDPRKPKDPSWSCPSLCSHFTAVAQSTTAAAQALAPGCCSNVDTDKANTETESVITKALATEAHDDTKTAHSDHTSITQHNGAPMLATDKPNDPGPATLTPHAKSTETDKLTAPTTTHNATVLDSNKLLTQEQQPDPPSRGLMASAQSQSPSATKLFKATAERHALASRARFYGCQHSCRAQHQQRQSLAAAPELPTVRRSVELE